MTRPGSESVYAAEQYGSLPCTRSFCKVKNKRSFYTSCLVLSSIISSLERLWKKLLLTNAPWLINCENSRRRWRTRCFRPHPPTPSGGIEREEIIELIFRLKELMLKGRWFGNRSLRFYETCEYYFSNTLELIEKCKHEKCDASQYRMHRYVPYDTLLFYSIYHG